MYSNVFKFVPSLLSAVLVLLLTGCTMAVTKHTASSVATYRYHETKKGLSVAVDPITDKKQIDQIFKTDLLGKGLLPVLVVAENNDPSRSFILAKNKVAFKSAATGANLASKHDKITSETGGNTVAVIGAVGVGVGSLAAAPLLFAGIKMASDAQVIELNLADKELRTHTLDTGTKAQGFAFFAFPKGSKLSELDEILVEVTEPSSGETTLFNFPLK